ncbi:hypothetical protein KZX49_11940 [Klebsiella quasipneumoniae]|uniref:hypothetical protein n=1 Tax=Klebsiella quasipneumoniae TaxID=1463165 RepID=UPI000A0F2A74|nr:hypothetical protein [Klebsiella quasipneumoniae]HBT4713833.1 hypothetical protein [Klebsiella quasipneumoniae subsp. quasipneumoniae]MDH1960329.1 hypothetical protein [Klebsiella quasipneumoniae]QYD23677.1 hypothetical protein KZX49_11940 [Klebsiella quasipneumoniae]SMG69998.1 ribosomal protein S4 [Klebsiella quasipneumoniae]HCB0361537.1 hypothetical protein [Klebsiella quasipneumoniae subsp. quasipneumoniae]
MLYVVECAYTDPQSEAAWNTFYNLEKLPALVSVPGFHASQRFCALSEGCPRYLALHDIRDAAVIDSDAYRRNGGGHFARWQSVIADWHRHLYLTTNTLREVAPDEVLLLSDTAEALPVAAPVVLQPGGLATRHTRYAAIVPRDDLHHHAATAAVFVYQPITARLRHPAEQA